jgi:hypothetical protein
MISRYSLALVLLAGVVKPSSGGATHSVRPVCDLAVFHMPADTALAGLPTPPDIRVPAFELHQTATLFLARATRDTARAGQGLVFQQRNTALQADQRPVFGQIVELERAVGAGADRVLSTRPGTRGSVRAVVVPWRVDLACGPNFWRGSAQWTQPDSLAVYVAELRPDSLWVEGRPTFDALRAEVNTYAYGPDLLYQRRTRPTPMQVFERNAAAR